MTIAKRMKQLDEISYRSAQRAHDALNWSDPADTPEELKAVDDWWNNQRVAILNDTPAS